MLNFKLQVYFTWSILWFTQIFFVTVKIDYRGWDRRNSHFCKKGTTYCVKWKRNFLLPFLDWHLHRRMFLDFRLWLIITSIVTKIYKSFWKQTIVTPFSFSEDLNLKQKSGWGQRTPLIMKNMGRRKRTGMYRIESSDMQTKRQVGDKRRQSVIQDIKMFRGSHARKTRKDIL